MLHQLPIRNVRLSPCSVQLETLPPVPGGHFCGHCQQVVHDFTHATAADLHQALATVPGGRLCGRFRGQQLAPRPRLRRWARQFLLVATLVLLRGLTAQQAWAQAQRTPPDTVVSTQAEVLPSEERAGGFIDYDPTDDGWTAVPAPARKKAAPHRAARRHPAPKARAVPRRATPR